MIYFLKSEYCHCRNMTYFMYLLKSVIMVSHERDDPFHMIKFRKAVLTIHLQRKTSIFVRKALQVRPRDQHRRQAAFISRFTLDVGRAPKCLPFVLTRIRHLGLSPTQARREGPAFFDEDDVCAVFRNCDTAFPNSISLEKNRPRYVIEI